MKNRIIIALMLVGTIGYSAARITNTDIATGANIAWSKMVALTASRAMVTDGSGNASASSVTAAALGYIANLGSDAQTQIDGKQPLDSDLTAVAGLSSTGLIARTGSGTASVRTITQPANGITISNGDGVSGNPTLALANDLLALEALSGTNVIPYRSATDVWSAVTVSQDLTFSGGTLSVTPPVNSAVAALDIDWSKVRASGGLFTKTLSANSTFTFSNRAAGQTIVVRLTNTASNYTVTWPTVKWASAAAPTMTTGAKSDIFTFVYDGTDVFGSAVQNLSMFFDWLIGGLAEAAA